MKDSEFINWIADRFVNVHKESENVDFVIKLRTIAMRLAAMDDVADAKTRRGK